MPVCNFARVVFTIPPLLNFCGLAARKHEFEMTETLYPRHLKAELVKSLGSARVVNVVGPRQSGKTTLVRDLLNIGLFVSFDDQKVLAAMEADPVGQLNALVAEAGDGPLIIDEAQR